MNADVVLVEGDPTTDMSAIRRVAMVTRGTDVCFPAEIHETPGIKVFVPPLALKQPQQQAHRLWRGAASASERRCPAGRGIGSSWRRGWDSNPRGAFKPPSDFESAPL